jgi:hypothetical protein
LRQRKGAKNPVDVTASDDLAELPEGALTLCFEQPVALIWDFISSAPIYGQFAVELRPSPSRDWPSAESIER